MNKIRNGKRKSAIIAAVAILAGSAIAMSVHAEMNEESPDMAPADIPALTIIQTAPAPPPKADPLPIDNFLRLNHITARRKKATKKGISETNERITIFYP